MPEEAINKTTYSTAKSVEIYSQLYLWPYEKVLFDRYITPGLSVLDVGCGTGRSTYFLNQRGVTVIGIDMVEAFINHGHELYPELDLRLMNATKLEFPDNSFDIVFFSNQGIDYTDRRLDVLREVYRVTKPGGVFAYSSHNSLYLPRTKKGWVNFGRNLRYFRLGYHFRIEHHPNGDLHVAHNNIWNEAKTLRQLGFKVIEILSNSQRFSSLPKLITGLFTRWPLFVCRKPL
ncbi:MAG: hypothetical protein A2571_01465 [Candidatus Vogelbacteria bacterium RIFOXYD1_FULL_44_32]|uniref:Methyltransferase type 11 domain-containing protein n=1 Tax=Candidatus Vogelbacteria bacterium RIFOXYD1_FULL_44_32 TaxID=1802438 RepID=A0A1G2QED5_9BACT|nr:MAG: hypothetical protein A2571_01465 [Candidatus Vogelbacteria bacterium RIFOXYD1_FULL_44_32]